MKKQDIMTKLNNSFGKVGFKLQKHSPEILLVLGVAGTVVSTVMACKATLKVEEIVNDTKEKMNVIHESKEKGCTPMGMDYFEKDAQKDTFVVYAKAGANLVKLFTPAMALGSLSITSIFASHNILKKRSVAIAAAYAAVDKSFKDYRSRLIKKYGQEVDKELHYNLKTEKTTETVIDEETGEKKKVKKTSFVVNPSDVSGYARFFEKYTVNEKGENIVNPNWSNNNEYNLLFIKAQESYANDLLIHKKRLFLNEVYEMLGLPPTKAGQIVGWVYDSDNPIGDNYVDFGLYSDNLSYSDYVNGFDPAILLDFNVDGNIWELM